MKLNHLTDKTLLTDTKRLVESERKLSTQILYHLREVEKRRLFSDLGYASLFDYCLRELGYSAPAAQRRIVSARLLEEIPEIEKPITEGHLSLSNVAMAASFLKNETREKKVEVLSLVQNLSVRECERKLFQITGESQSIKEKERRISVSQKALTIVLKDETLERVKEFKSLTGLNNWDDSLSKMSFVALQEIRRSKFKITVKPRGSSVGSGRYISASTKREVYERDQVCQKCGTIYRLHFDHQKPHALGGENSPENIRLLCFSCNQRERIRARL